MKKCRLLNISTGEEILNKVTIADSFYKRLKGLLGQKYLNDGEGIFIKPCNSVHTFGMKMNIDVLFLDKDCQVIHIIHDLTPNKTSPIVKKSKYVIETNANYFCDKVNINDHVKLLYINN